MIRKLILSDLAAIAYQVLQVPRRWANDTQLVKQDAQGQSLVYVRSAAYDDETHSWMYTLNDWQNKPIPGKTVESMLVDRRTLLPQDSDFQNLESKVLEPKPHDKPFISDPSNSPLKLNYLPQELWVVDKDEEQGSNLQDLDRRVLDDEPYEASPTYMNVKVLLLCWEDSRIESNVKTEVDALRDTFEDRFGFQSMIQYLDPKLHRIEIGLRGGLKHIIADFVNWHDDPNTLLIVYYAGYGVWREWRDSKLVWLVTYGHRIT